MKVSSPFSLIRQSIFTIKTLIKGVMKRNTPTYNRIRTIVENVTREFLNENLGTNQKKARNAYLKYNFPDQTTFSQSEKDEAFQYVNHKQIGRDIPNALADDMYFACAAIRLHFDEGIDTREVNNIIKQALAHKSKFDNNMNGLSYDDILEMFDGEEEDGDDEQDAGNGNYTLHIARTFEEAKAICDTIPNCDWCIARSEDSFNRYTGDYGFFLFYLRDGYQNVKQVSGDNAPLDSYGTSAFAVGVEIDELYIETNGFGFAVDPRIEDKTITCRWNHANDGDDYVVDVEELSDIVGEDIDDVMVGVVVDIGDDIGYKIEKEIDELGKRISKDVGLKTIITEFIDEYIDGDINLKELKDNIRRKYEDYAMKVYYDYPLISEHDLSLVIISDLLYRDIDFLKLILGDEESTSKTIEYNGHTIIFDEDRDEMYVLKPLSSSKGVYVSEDGQYIDMNSKIMKLVVYDKELKTIDIEEGFNIDDYVLLYDHSVVTAIDKNAGENVLEKIRDNIGEQGYNFALERLKQGDYIHTFELLARVKYMKVYIR